jgi:hypothetical protein
MNNLKISFVSIWEFNLNFGINFPIIGIYNHRGSIHASTTLPIFGVKSKRNEKEVFYTTCLQWKKL